MVTGAEWPDLSVAPASEGGGEQDAAVVVGIENYSFLAPVPGAVDNAKDWYRWLKETRGVRAVKLLTDGSATRHSILAAVEDAARRVGEGGTLWFVFIGHGAPLADGDDGVLVGATAQQRVVDFFPNTISRSELLDALEQGQQDETLVVLDACFSGRQSGGAALVPDLQPALVSGTWKPKRSTVLTAAKGDQFAGPLPGERRPAFSYLVLGALRGWGDRDGNRRVTVREALDYASDAMFEVVDDRTQTPSLLGPGGELVLARPSRPESGPDLTEFVASASPAPAPLDSVVGHVETSTGSETDLLALAEEARQLRAEREAKEAREREIEAHLEAERERRYDEAVDTLRADAQSEWLALAPLLEGGGPEVVRVVELYVGKYAAAAVTIDGERHPVNILQVSDAREWLRRAAGSVVDTVVSEGLFGLVTGPHGYEMIPIEPGEFVLGNPLNEEHLGNDGKRHRVRLTSRYYLGATEVTQDLYESVAGENPSNKRGPRRPVENVTWLEAVLFCNELSQREGLAPAYEIVGESVDWVLDADGYRLPTEAEWEWAARGGGPANTGASQGEPWSWTVTAEGAIPNEVAGSEANGYGLHDMDGNVKEWVWDRYAEYPTGTATDPMGPTEGGRRVFCGCNWSYNGLKRGPLAFRGWATPDKRWSRRGFRIARSLP